MEYKPVKQTSLKATYAPGQKNPGWLSDIPKKRLIRVTVIVVAIFIVVLALWAFVGGQPQRSESYKEISGAAGLNATITYDCNKPCEQKFNFNVYVLAKDGNQVSVVRPDNDGHVRLALPEGNYVMLIGKQFGKGKLFPQEPIALKNGKELELKLHYKEGELL